MNPTGIKGIKERLKATPLPSHGVFNSTEEIGGEIYGVNYSVTFGHFGEHYKGPLEGLLYVVTLSGSKNNCKLALEDFISELEEPPLNRLEIPDKYFFGMYFWKAKLD